MNTQTYPFQFTGNGSEYFRIWIVNLALSIVTLGIYSAWAKVRRKRYFHNHTYLDENNFDYLANPVAILKGRAIAVALLIMFSLVNETMPLVGIVLGLMFLVVLPWIVVSAFQFNAANTTHRGLRFRFRGALGEAAKAYLMWPVLSVFTLGLLTPYAQYRKAAFVANGHAYGDIPFQFRAELKSYYKVFLQSGLFLLPVLLSGVWLFFTVIEKDFLLMILAGFNALIWLIVASSYLRAHLARLQFNRVSLREARLVSRHDTLGLLKVSISNFCLILVTFGLYAPWAQVRMARYWLDNLALKAPEGALDYYIGGPDAARANARGEEMAETFDVDLALT